MTQLPTYTLVRNASTAEGTFGELRDPSGKVMCLTLEDPWKNNNQGISCIPTGSYEFVPHSGEKYKNVWRLLNVPGREAILIHQGNTHLDTRGCILVGNRLGTVKGIRGIINSLVTLNWLRGILPKRGVLVVRYADGVNP